MKFLHRTHSPIWLMIILVTLGVFALLAFLPSTGNAITVTYQPSEGWTVCADLGVGPVPGLNITRQRFRLCSDTGWQILAYCLEPEKDMPPIGRMCSEVDPGVFWCGDDVQQLQFYQVAQRPSPGPTSTRTPTRTTTPTSTATFTATTTRQAVTLTSTVTSTPVRAGQSTSTPVPTSVFDSGGGRQQPGGESNLLWVGLFLGSSGGAIWLQARGIRRILRKR